jgi:5-methylcytosine-specific restriction endonuclease McrA
VDECKRCPRCGETKSRSEFSPSKQKADGLFPWCRPCNNTWQTTRRFSSPEMAEASRAYQRAYYQAHAEERVKTVTARYQANREQYDAYKRKWLAENPEKRKAAARKWRQANRDKVNLTTNQRRARRMSAPTIPFTVEQLAARLDFFGRCCWVCGGAAEAVDHVKPLSKGGWHCLSNLRPICGVCNTRKKDRWPLSKEELVCRRTAE